MEALEKLSTHLKTRLVDLRRAKEQGGKIIGYTPGGYLPVELVLASGSIPICMIRGGDHSVVELAGAYICHWIDTFCRAQIGYGVSGDDPYYNIIDLLVIPITDNHVRAISDILDYNTNLEIFPFGVPHMKEESAFKYYRFGISKVKTKLEELTGVEITDGKLSEGISLVNRERELLRAISMLRRSEQVPLRSRDFITLCHGSLLADTKFMVDVLESFYHELIEQEAPPLEGPRILLTGSTLALGDYRILELIENAGGVVVVEDFAEGISPYWVNVPPNGDLLQSLAECYFMQRVPPAWFRPGKERLDFLIKLAKGFKVDGVIWYQLMHRESYKTESYYFPDRLKREVGIPMLTVESDYGPAETEPLRTRIETFIETIRR
jgi:benzoyl-CoA reductase/2-hydroxyglutaryl-CoA dehydratase subunit BcrC/BadD/HgdB